MKFMATGRIAFVALVLGLSIATAGCGSAGSSLVPVPVTNPPTASPSAGDTSAAGSGAPSLDLSGNTSDVPIRLANALGCTNVDSNAQLDNWVSSEVTCLFGGDNEVTIFSFASATNEQKWFALGPESADESGTVVRGDGWAVEPFDQSQAAPIQHIVGGVVEQQR